MNYSIKKPMPPLWIMYPHISCYSIGWRMGYGEGYKDDFWKWFESLTDNEQNMYKEMFPEPKLWRMVYNENYDFEDTEDYEYKAVQFWDKNGAWKYDRKKIIDEYNISGKMDCVYFWKPQDGIVDESCLGQWKLSKFKVDEDDYLCAEQYMMAEKARLFNDVGICNEIMKSENPKEMKALGKKVKNFDQLIWDKVKYSIVLNGNYYKFTQDKGLRDYLLSTGNKILVEASPVRYYLGNRTW